MKLGISGGSQQVGRIARRLAAYIPRALANRILRGEIPVPGQGRRLMAATLFCDVSGFSTMASELAADGPRGAEELNRILLMTFTGMINAIHNAGGVVSHFHGDAMMVYMPDDDGQAAVRALACAQFMQNLIQGGYSQVVANRSANKQTIFELSMKVGVGYGEVLELVVGDVESSLEFVAAGAAIDEAVQAESYAQSGQVVASQAVLQKAWLPASADFRIVTEVMPVPYTQSPIHWDAYGIDKLWELANLAAAFVPAALHERIMADHSYFVAEHRPATSIFVRYDGLDYEAQDAGAQLQAYYDWAREIVGRFGGENSRVNRILTGDKGSVLHIIFGAPVAPEVPEQALRCAFTLQQEKPAYIKNQKIGVTTGQVFACAVGSQNRREYTVVGDVVNLSSRLMTHCPENGVLVDDVTARKAREYIEFEPFGQVKFKGFAEEIKIHLAVGLRQSNIHLRNRFGVHQRPLVWRKNEEQTLLSEVEKAQKGMGRAVALFGSTNAEHTRLIAAGAHQWLDHDGQLIVGIGQQNTSELPFGVWHGVWRDFFGLTADMTAEEQIKAIQAQLKAHNPRVDREDIQLWCSLLGLPVMFNHITQNERLNRISQAMQIYFRAAAHQHPLMIVLENLHWADAQSLALLNQVAHQWRQAPILLVMTFTPSDTFALAQLPDCQPIVLEELTVAAGRQLVKALLNGLELPPSLLRHLGLHEKEGLVNPIYLEESVNMMLADGVLRVNGHVHVNETALATLRIPDNVQSLLRTRFDRISATGRTVLQAASVIGREFDIATLTRAIPNMSAQQVQPLLKELQDAGLIMAAHNNNLAVYYFHDDMVQEVAYESIPYGRRQRWHAAVAEWLLQQNKENLKPLYPLLAYHYGRTDLHERGLKFALAAAEDAQAILATQAAIELYSVAETHFNALADPAQWRTFVSMLTSRAEMNLLSGHYESALVDVEQAIEIALHHKDALHVGLGYGLLARIKCFMGESTEAIELTELIISGLANRIPLEKLAYAWVTNAEALTYMGKFPQARSSFQKALDLFTRTNETAGLIHTHLLWGYEYSSMLGSWVEARDNFDKAEQLIQESHQHLPSDEVRLYLGRAQMELRCGSKDEAADYLRQAAAVINERGVNWWRPVQLYFQAAVHLAQREFDVARGTLEQALTAVDEGGNPDYRPLILLELAHLAHTDVQERRYLIACVEAAKTRARHLDRLHCLQVGKALGYQQ